MVPGYGNSGYFKQKSNSWLGMYMNTWGGGGEGGWRCWGRFFLQESVYVRNHLPSMVLCYGTRLWKLRVLQAEIKLMVRYVYEYLGGVLGKAFLTRVRLRQKTTCALWHYAMAPGYGNSGYFKQKSNSWLGRYMNTAGLVYAILEHLSWTAADVKCVLFTAWREP